jgi:hypothetical protein
MVVVMSYPTADMNPEAGSAHWAPAVVVATVVSGISLRAHPAHRFPAIISNGLSCRRIRSSARG